MSAYVVDASVAVKWLIGEPGTRQALAVRQHALSAPDLLIVEFANILWKKLHRGELTEVEALLASRLLARADIDLVPMRSLVQRAIELAILLDHAAYDCVYLALAETTDRPLITADARLLRKLAAERTESRRIAATDLAAFPV